MREFILNDLQIQDSIGDILTRGFKQTIGTDELWVRVIGKQGRPMLVSIILSLGGVYADSPCTLEATYRKVKDDKYALKIINDTVELFMIQREGFYNITIQNEIHYK